MSSRLCPVSSGILRYKKTKAAMLNRAYIQKVWPVPMVSMVLSSVRVISTFVPHSEADWAAALAGCERVDLRAGQPAHQLNPAGGEGHEDDEGGHDPRHAGPVGVASDEEGSQDDQRGGGAWQGHKRQPSPARTVDDGQPDQLRDQVGHSERDRNLHAVESENPLSVRIVGV
jgi:hypothetical protein